VGRQEVIEREPEPGHNRRHGRRQEDGGPGVEPFPADETEHHDEVREDSHQAQHDVQEVKVDVERPQIMMSLRFWSPNVVPGA